MMTEPVERKYVFINFLEDGITKHKHVADIKLILDIFANVVNEFIDSEAIIACTFNSKLRGNLVDLSDEIRRLINIKIIFLEW